MNTREQDLRTLALIGEEALSRIKNSKVALFGVGGVGSYCAEALVRAGVGEIALFDCDEVSLSNLNRQLVALHSTVGKKKVDVMRERILDINPDCKVSVCYDFLTAEHIEKTELSCYDLVIDAIDTVSVKLAIAEACYRKNIAVISSMGTGNKLDPSMFRIADLYSTKVCPLARVMRTELRKRGVDRLTVLYSEETPISPAPVGEKADGKRAPASISFVPSAAGLLIAREALITIGKLNEKTT